MSAGARVAHSCHLQFALRAAGGRQLPLPPPPSLPLGPRMSGSRCRKQPNLLARLPVVGPTASGRVSTRAFSAPRAAAMSKEDEAAAANAPLRDTGAPTIFDKIINKEIPATIVYEDDKVVAFRDISPQAPTHILLIPRDRDGLTGICKAEERHKDVLGHLLLTATVVAKQEKLDAYRIVVNDGPDAGQSVYHLHVHLLGGRRFTWPPG